MSDILYASFGPSFSSAILNFLDPSRTRFHLGHDNVSSHIRCMLAENYDRETTKVVSLLIWIIMSVEHLRAKAISQCSGKKFSLHISVDYLEAFLFPFQCILMKSQRKTQ